MFVSSKSAANGRQYINSMNTEKSGYHNWQKTNWSFSRSGSLRKYDGVYRSRMITKTARPLKFLCYQIAKRLWSGTMGDSVYGVYSAPPMSIHDKGCRVILSEFRAETADLLERCC